jgi:hypothetical protein
MKGASMAVALALQFGRSKIMPKYGGTAARDAYAKFIAEMERRAKKKT